MNRYDLGVLFVHGIGDQPKSDTLVRCGDPLQEWAGRWLTGDRASAQAASVQIRNAELTSDASPAHATLVMSTTAWTSRWLLAESWWATTFRPPQYRDLWEWAALVAPWAIAVHFARKVHLAKDWRAISVTVATFIVATAFLPIVMVAMLGLLLLGSVPIPQLRAAILRAQQLLVGTVGDSYVYLTSSIQGAAIISKVHKDLKWLADQGCTRIAVVAHSQGAAVAHAAINHPDALRPDLLLTFGSGLNKLLLLDHARGDKTSALRTWLLSLCLLSMGGLIGFAALALVTGAPLHPTWPDSPIAAFLDLFGVHLYQVWLQVLVVAAVSFLFVFSISFAGKIPVKRRIVGSFQTVLPVIAGAALFYLGFFVAGQIGLFVVFLSSMMFSAWVTLEMRSGATIFFTDLALGDRMRLRRDVPWTDFYATADPVPNGPPFPWPVPSVVESRPVYNTGSIFGDHSAYWSNRDEFVSRVACKLGQTAGLDVATASENGAARLDRASHRRAWRVQWLQRSRRIILVSGLIMMSMLWRPHVWTDLSSLPRWLAAVGAYISSFVTKVPLMGGLVSTPSLNSAIARLLWLSSWALAVWLTLRLMLLVWRWWERADLAALFGGKDYELFPASFVVLLMLPVSAMATMLAAPWFHEVFDAVSSAVHAHDDRLTWFRWTFWLAASAGISGAFAEAFARDVFGGDGWARGGEWPSLSFTLAKHALAAFPFAATIALTHRMGWMKPLSVHVALVVAFVILGVALHFTVRWLGTRCLSGSAAGPLQLWLARAVVLTSAKGDERPATASTVDG